MEGVKIKIGEDEFQCVGKCGEDWAFMPLNKDTEEVVIYSDNDLEELRYSNAFELVTE